MELAAVSAKYKGKVSVQFLACLPYFKAGQAKKVSKWDYVTSLPGGGVSIVYHKEGGVSQTIATLINGVLTVCPSKAPSLKFRALAIADYFGIHFNPYIHSPQTFSVGQSVVSAPVSTSPQVIPPKGKVTLTFEVQTGPSTQAPSTTPYAPLETPKVRENKTWELHTDKLMPAASDFYLLAGASAKAPWVRYYFLTEARRTARLIANYLAMAIGGEIHYSRSKPEWLKVKSGHREGSAAEWKTVWDELGGVEATTRAIGLFRLKCNWPGSAYGGPAWARIAEALLKWLTGEFTDVLFVDHTMDLQHNTGTCFSKWFTDLHDLKYLLDAKFKGKAEPLMRHASDNVRRIYLNTAATPVERVKWAKEYGVERVRQE